MTKSNPTLRARHLLLAGALLPFAGVQAQSVDLLTVFQIAQESDPQLRQQQASLRATAEGIPQAFATLILPSVSGSANMGRSRNETELAEGAIGQGGVITSTSQGYGININQQVFNFGSIINYKIANKQFESAQYALSSTYQNLIVRVAQAYFNVLRAVDNLAFAEANLESTSETLRQQDERFEVGLIAITDVEEARSGADTARANLISAQNQLDNAREALREITQVYYEDLLPLGPELPLTPPEPNDVERWAETALMQNNDVARALIDSDIAFDRIRSAKAGHLPSVSLSGGYSFSSSVDSFGGRESTGGRLSISLSLPIFDGGRVNSQARQASHNHDASLASLDGTIRSVERNLRQAFLAINAAISSVSARRQAVVSARTALRSTQAGNEVGTRTTVDVVAAQQRLFSALRDYSGARYDYVIAMLQLKQAAGTLSPEDLTQVNDWLSAEGDQLLETEQD